MPAEPKNAAPGRPVWSGYLRLSLVAVPVRAYPAVKSERESLHFNQLHAQEDCHRRINYQKTCPVHGALTKEDIILGYEYAPNQYVPVSSQEVDELRAASEKSIALDEFIPESAVDPLQFGGKPYYLLPDGQVGGKPYALLARAMREHRVRAIGQVVMFGSDHVVLVWPKGKLLVMSQLNYEQEIKDPAAFDDFLPDEQVSAAELKLTKTLIDASTASKVDLTHYKNRYAERLRALIDAKVAGREVVAPPVEEEAPVINIMDALRKSMAQVTREKGGRARASKTASASSAKTGQRRSKRRAS